MLAILIGFDEEFHKSVNIDNKLLAGVIRDTESDKDVAQLIFSQYEAKYMDTSLCEVTDSILLIENDEVIRTIDT